MIEKNEIGLDFIVDKLTNSIKNVISGDSFQTTISKSKLIEHYIETLGAVHLGGRLMMIDTKAALELVKKYY